MRRQSSVWATCDLARPEGRMSTITSAKRLGQYFTPDEVATALVRWAVRHENDRLLDPACGDGRFLQAHDKSLGVDLAGDWCAVARTAAPLATVHAADFFSWALVTPERFDCAAGNPPFIRYHHFRGESRENALRLAARMGVRFSGLSSSWAPFVIGAASLLKPGGRLAFVVPAEIGHAPYATPLLEGLCAHFDDVRVIAIKEKLFPRLSEDTWLLFADGFGGQTACIGLVKWETFCATGSPPEPHMRVLLHEWRKHGCRLRKHLVAGRLLERYAACSERRGVTRLGDVATVGIGYVTGANDFFHLRPSAARSFDIPPFVLRPSVRRGDQLPPEEVGEEDVREWIQRDQPILLLHLAGVRDLPASVIRYLDTDLGHRAREAYKCRNRSPWYVVPNVEVPDGFVTYMSGKRVALVRNSAGCVCTNSVHALRITGRVSLTQLQAGWSHPLCALSAELEGHPLGGGLLKLEPGEASRILIPLDGATAPDLDMATIEAILREARSWRHYEW